MVTNPDQSEENPQAKTEDQAEQQPASAAASVDSAGDSAKQQSAPEASGEAPLADVVALVNGKAFTSLPNDLYIPPDALEVFLEQFEGPLDLLLYLIRKQNLDILDIPLLRITQQYMEYIDLMQEMRFELAAEYLVMAAMLAEIKSRMLLPRPPVDEEEDEIDPRAELIRRLQQYEQFKMAAQDIDGLQRMGRDIHRATADIILFRRERPQPKVELDEVLLAFKDVLVRAEMYSHHQIQMEALSVRERMSGVLEKIRAGGFVEFTTLFEVSEGRMGVVVTLLAILELIKESLVELVQAKPFAQIHVQLKSQEADADNQAVVAELDSAQNSSEDSADDGDVFEQPGDEQDPAKNPQ